ncbi:MAG TPA: hypothetical protein VH853_16840 [Polyangia bacterium]|jgi:hypothetical protein|nr:hypothetical protein [Polyangia bacterium]
MTHARFGWLAFVGAAVVAGGAAGCGSAPAAGSREIDAGTPDAPLAADGDVLDVGVGPWTARPDAAAPAPLDDVTVYAFSQTGDNQTDPQIITLAPDMSIRTFSRWDTYGTRAGDYDFSYVTSAHAVGVKLIGGTTSTVLFEDEFPNAQFPATSYPDLAARDATGAVVIHPSSPKNYHRGSLANPIYRDYLIGIGELQIDGGVDGLFFDELNQDYQGATYDGNEGFDTYHLADFNAYLLWRFPGADYSAMFGMTADNTLKASVAPGDLTNNFNYQKYLASKGWGTSPFASGNPLASIWGQTVANRPAPGASDFVDSAEPYRYWGQIAATLRAYAQQEYGRSIYLTSNGVWPLVDFQGVGLYEFNQDGDGGAEAEYVPVTPGSTTTAANLDGTVSLQRPFLNLKARSAALAPGAPVVLFIDWPTNFMSYYLHLPASEQQDYWRIYAAEAYANGLYFAFFLLDTVGDPSATELGLMPFFQSLTAFYRAHAGLYHGVTASAASVISAVTTSLTTPVMIAVSDQAQPRRRLVHLVNHDYSGALVEHDGVTVTIPLPSAPASVTLASPDTAGDTPLTPSYANGAVTVTLPSLVAYDVVAIAY